jgi:hypothetical protein
VDEPYQPLELPGGRASTLELRLEEGTSGSTRRRVRRGGGGPEFIVSLLGATLSKMEELHHRELTLEDVRAGIHRAVERAEGYLDRGDLPPGEAPSEIAVSVRDSGLADLRGVVVGPTNDVPP